MSNHRISRKHPKPGHRGDWHVFWPVLALCTVLLLFGAFVIVWQYREDSPKKSDIPVIALSEGQNLHLDQSKLRSSQLHLFEASASGQRVKFIVQRTPDQIVHVALASCKACYRNRDTHYARNGDMICGKCREAMEFEAKGRPVSTTHCALVDVPHTESDSEVAVLVRDVLAQAAKLPQ
jgi:uncharacterized membrane protein